MKSKRIAWDAVSFLIPANWELALYKFLKKGITRVEIEDEYAVRMEAEWIRPTKRLHMNTILARYEQRSRKLTMRASHRKPIEGLPAGWIATHYTLSETVPNTKRKTGLQVVKHGLVTAFYLSPDSRFFAFVILHFLPDDKEDPAAVTSLVASEFRQHLDGPLVPWQLYDIAFELPRDFLLESTLFDIGSKLMAFRWNRRRFYLWHFSCADMFLKEGIVPEKWAAGHLNDFRRIRGGKFFVDSGGQIRWRRRRRHLIAYRDEIAHWCFKYEARCHIDPEKNQLVAWVFHYRRQADLGVIPESLRFGDCHDLVNVNLDAIGASAAKGKKVTMR